MAHTDALQYPSAGTIVSTDTHIFWRHRGIVSDRWHGGKPMVISASARSGVACEELWDAFSSGKPVRDEGYPDLLPPWEVLRRARALMGREYRLLEFNCDHFVALAHGQEARSPQLGATLTIALLFILVRAAARG